MSLADAPPPWQADLVKIGLPLAFSLVTAILGYYLGRRAKHDDIAIKKRHELGSDVSIAFQEVLSLYDRLNRSFEVNFLHHTVDEVADSFERYSHLHADDVSLIQELGDKRAHLDHLVRSGRLYLNSRLLDRMTTYLRTGDFAYTTDGGIMVNTYIRDFFANLRDPKLSTQRRDLANGLLKDMTNLIK